MLALSRLAAIHDRHPGSPLAHDLSRISMLHLGSISIAPLPLSRTKPPASLPFVMIKSFSNYRISVHLQAPIRTTRRHAAYRSFPSGWERDKLTTNPSPGFAVPLLHPCGPERSFPLLQFSDLFNDHEHHGMLYHRIQRSSGS